MIYYHIIEFLSLITFVYSVWLFKSDNKIAWVYSFVSCVLMAIVMIKDQLYWNTVIQIVWAVQSLVGLYIWRQDSISKRNMNLIDPKYNIIALLSVTSMGILTPFVLGFDSIILDMLTFWIGFIATILLYYKFSENWLVWSYLNSIFIIWMFQIGLPFIAIAYVIANMISLTSFNQWSKETWNYEQQTV